MAELNRILPAEGRPNKEHGISNPINPIEDACVSFSALCHGLTKWAVETHPYEIPERSLERPIDRLLQGMKDLPPPTFVSNLDELDIITGMTDEVTVSHNGISRNYLDYRSPELAEIARKQPKPKFKTTIKYDPNDIGRIWAKDPVDETWIEVPCTRQDYAAGLSMTQHKYIRAQAKDRLKKAGAYEVLMQARHELHEFFSDAIKSGKKQKRAMKDFAKFQNLSSISLTPPAEPVNPISAEKAIPLEELKFSSDDIPIFTAFDPDDSSAWMR